MEQLTTNTKRWLYCAMVRSVKTMAQAFIACVATSEVVTIGGVDWKYTASVVIMAGVLSIVTSLAGLPEVE